MVLSHGFPLENLPFSHVFYDFLAFFFRFFKGLSMSFPTKSLASLLRPPHLLRRQQGLPGLHQTAGEGLTAASDLRGEIPWGPGAEASDRRPKRLLAKADGFGWCVLRRFFGGHF